MYYIRHPYRRKEINVPLRIKHIPEKEAHVSYVCTLQMEPKCKQCQHESEWAKMKAQQEREQADHLSRI